MLISSVARFPLLGAKRAWPREREDQKGVARMRGAIQGVETWKVPMELTRSRPL